MSEQPSDVRAKILIAEDDAIVALDLQGMIMRMGYDVVAIVNSGQAAVAAVKRFLPDIVILDIILNGSMDGIEVAREIHTASDIPVIFCLASADLSSLARAKEISYAGYLLKPINPDSLATTLDTVLYKYKLEKRVQRAEEKSRSLEQKQKMLACFLEDRSSYEWNWTAESSIRFSSDDASEAIRSLAPKLEAFVASFGDERATASGLIETVAGDRTKRSFAVLAMREGPSISGLLVPLTYSESECPPK
jgi:CheY-like chemotaxis protein